MKCLLFVVLMFTLSAGYSQADLFNSTSLPKNILTIEGYDVTMKTIPVGSQNRVEGSPMINTNYEKGLVKFKTGEEYKDVQLNFSLLLNQLYFLRDSVQMKFANEVELFAMPVDVYGKKLVSFKSGFPAINDNTDKTFYQVLADGSKLQLLKFASKKVEDVYHYNGPAQKVYTLKERLFLYDVAGKRMYEAGGNANALKRTFPAFSRYIDDFTTEKKLNLKKEDDLAALVNYINEQP